MNWGCCTIPFLCWKIGSDLKDRIENVRNIRSNCKCSNYKGRLQANELFYDLVVSFIENWTHIFSDIIQIIFISISWRNLFLGPGQVSAKTLWCLILSANCPQSPQYHLWDYNTNKVSWNILLFHALIQMNGAWI